MLRKFAVSTLLSLAVVGPGAADTSGDDVLTLAIRSVPDQEAWKAASKPFAALMAKAPGIVATAEFMSVMGFAPVDAQGKPVANVFVGMTQLDNQAAYDAITAQYAGAEMPAVVTDYLKTVESIAEVIVQPIGGTPALDLAHMVQEGQVLEIALRDVSGADFADFDAKRKAFVDVLTAQPGVIREFQYRSADGKYHVGMTLYADAPALQAIAANPAVVQGPEIGALMQSHPPMVAQYLVRIQ